MKILARPRLASTLLLATALAASPLSAEAHWNGGGGGGGCYNCGGSFAGGALLGLGVGALVGGALAPRYYAPPPPPPVYYAPPPPVYYAPPPPVYYAPPPGYYAR